MDSNSFQGFSCDYVTESGTHNVKVWSVPEGLDLDVTLPSAELVPCRFARGEVTSRFIERQELRGVYGDWAMVATIPKTLSQEVQEVALKAANDFLGQNGNSFL